jgi:hypothetical protein
MISNMVKKKAKDILLGVLRDVEESKRDDAAKKPIDLAPSVKIVQSDTSVKRINYGDIPSSRCWKIRDDLLEWKHNDFAMYLINRVMERVTSTWMMNKVGVTLYIGRIKQSLANILGFCDNIVLKDYLDFFVDEWASYYFKKDSDLFMPHFRRGEAMKSFAERYDYQSSFRRFISKVKGKKTILERKEITDGEIEKVFLSGGENLLLEYGILIPANWLIKCKKYSLEQSVRFVSSAFRKLYNVNNWKKVVKITEEYCPYPIWFQIQSCDKLTPSAGEKIEVNLSFSEKCNWCFF